MKEIVECRVPRDPLVDPVGLDQTLERLLRKTEALDRRMKRHEDRMPRPVFVRGVQFLLEPIEKRQAIAGRLVADVVDGPAVGVQRLEMRTHPPRNKPRDHGEVLVVRACEVSADGSRLGKRRRSRGRIEKRTQVSFYHPWT